MSQSAHNDFSSLRVLCVLDDAVIRSAIKSALQRKGCRDVVQGNGGMDALDLRMGRTFDLIVCDLQMQPMTGLDFLRALSTSGLAANWPVIMLGAETDPAIIKEAQTLGVSAWIGKPVSIPVLVDRVSAVLRLSGQITGSTIDPERAALTERTHSHLAITLNTVEETVRGMSLRAREAAALAHGLRPLLDAISGHANTLGYGLVGSLCGRAIDVTSAMVRNPSAAMRGHADAARALGALVTTMKRVSHARTMGDGGEAGAVLLGKIDSILDPVRARMV
jgi:two-component system, chemotaxis family, chemotaxis protein CheY